MTTTHFSNVLTALILVILRYDPKNKVHRTIKKNIEEGDGLPDMCVPSEIVKSLEKAGFEIVEHRDVALDEDVSLTGASSWYEYLLPSWNIFSQRFQVIIGSVLSTTINFGKITKYIFCSCPFIMTNFVWGSRSPVSPSPPSLTIIYISVYWLWKGDDLCRALCSRDYSSCPCGDKQSPGTVNNTLYFQLVLLLKGMRNIDWMMK